VSDDEAVAPPSEPEMVLIKAGVVAYFRSVQNGLTVWWATRCDHYGPPGGPWRASRNFENAGPFPLLDDAEACFPPPKGYRRPRPPG
jgi:hypothetical protein